MTDSMPKLAKLSKNDNFTNFITYQGSLSLNIADQRFGNSLVVIGPPARGLVVKIFPIMDNKPALMIDRQPQAGLLLMPDAA